MYFSIFLPKLKVKSCSYKDLIKVDPQLADRSVCYKMDWSQFHSGIKFLIVEDETSSEFLASLAVCETNRKGFRHLSNVPFLPDCGLWVKQSKNNLFDRQSLTKRVLSTLSLYFNDWKWVNVSFPREIHDAQPFMWSGYSVSPRYTYLLDLDKNEEELRKGFSKKMRYSLSKMEKMELKTIETINVKATQTIFDSSAKNRPAEEKSFLSDILKKWNEIGGSSYNIVSSADGHYGCVFAVELTNETIYLLGGSDRVKGDSFGTIALWQAICQAKNKGSRVFNFEGSMLKGVEKYFRSFGGEIVPYYSVSKEPNLIRAINTVKSLFLKR